MTMVTPEAVFSRLEDRKALEEKQRQEDHETNRFLAAELKSRWLASGKRMEDVAKEMNVSHAFLCYLLNGKRLWTASLYSNFSQALAVPPPPPQSPPPPP